MNTVSKLIKGLILTVILVASFNINIEGKTVSKNYLTINFSNEAFAKTVGIGGACTGGNACDSTGSCDNGICIPKTDDQLMNEASGSGTDASASGDNTKKPPVDAKLPADYLKSVSQASEIIFKIFDPAVFFLTKHISNFLGTDLVFGGNMGKNLHAIWVISRNIVNVVFVLILLYLAVRHIFGEESDLKKVLPKFVIMLIAVNFSWLGAKLVVDAANVATNVVFAIPNGVKGLVTMQKTENMKCEISPNGEKITNAYCMPASVWWPGGATKTVNMRDADCKNGGKYTTKLANGTIATYGAVEEGYGKAYKDSINVATDGQGNATGTTDAVKTDPTSPYYQTITFCWNDLDIGKFDSSNAAYQLTYSMARVQNLAKSQTGDDISKLAIGTIFAFFIKVMYLLAFAGLFIALIIRMAMLWILVAFSPFIVLMMFSEVKIIGEASKGIENYLSINAFTKWAFAPAKVAAVWTIGYIMITTGQTATTDIFENLDKMATVTGRVFQVNSIFMGMNSLQEVIWLIMTIGIIWMGTFAVLKDLPVSSKVTNWINERGTNFAGFLGKLPMAAPIVPTITPTGFDWKHRQGIKTTMEKYSWQNALNSISGDKDAVDIAEASKKFNKSTNVQPLLNETDSGKILDQFKDMSKLTQEQIKRNFPTEAKLQEFLEAHPLLKDKKEKTKDLAHKIYSAAQGNSPTNPEITVNPNKPSDVTAAAVEKGVIEGLKKAGFKANDEVIKKAAEEAVKQPGISEKSAVETIVNKLKIDETTTKLPKEPAEGGNPAAPAAPTKK